VRVTVKHRSHKKLTVGRQPHQRKESRFRVISEEEAKRTTKRSTSLKMPLPSSMTNKLCQSFEAILRSPSEIHYQNSRSAVRGPRVAPFFVRRRRTWRRPTPSTNRRIPPTSFSKLRSKKPARPGIVGRRWRQQLDLVQDPRAAAPAIGRGAHAGARDLRRAGHRKPALQSGRGSELCLCQAIERSQFRQAGMLLRKRSIRSKLRSTVGSGQDTRSQKAGGAFRQIALTQHRSMQRRTDRKSMASQTVIRFIEQRRN
jgi:hypothetical protein